MVFCRKGVRDNSIVCAECLKWVHKSSVLVPLLFVLFISPIANVISTDQSNQNNTVSFHQYADDTQLYICTNW